MEKAVEFARREAQNSFRIWGNLGDAHWLAKGDAQKGRSAWLEAAAIAEKQLTGTPADAERLSLMANYLAKAGDKEGALRRIKSALDYGGDRAPVRYQAGLTYARLGQHEQAIEEIRLAIAYKYSKTEIQAAPELELLRMDPRFQQLFQSSSGR